MSDTARPCGCSTRGLNAVNETVHAAWHALVADQGGPTAGPVNMETLKAARGHKTLTSHADTVLDRRARESGKRASGRLREASR